MIKARFIRRARIAALMAATTPGCFVHASTSAEMRLGGAEAPACAATPTEDLWFGLVTHTEAGPQQNAFDQPLHTGDRIGCEVTGR